MIQVITTYFDKKVLSYLNTHKLFPELHVTLKNPISMHHEKEDGLFALDKNGNFSKSQVLKKKLILSYNLTYLRNTI